MGDVHTSSRAQDGVEIHLDSYLEKHEDDDKENCDETKDSNTCTAGKVPETVLRKRKVANQESELLAPLSELDTNKEGISTMEDSPAMLERMLKTPRNLKDTNEELLEVDDDSSHHMDLRTGTVCHHHPLCYLRVEIILIQGAWDAHQYHGAQEPRRVVHSDKPEQASRHQCPLHGQESKDKVGGHNGAEESLQVHDHQHTLDTGQECLLLKR